MQVKIHSHVLVVDLANPSYPYLSVLDATTGAIDWSYQAREAHQFNSEESAHSQITNYIRSTGNPDAFKFKMITFRKVVKYGAN